MSAYKDRYGPAALVTGASSGIGEAFAQELAARGFDLVLVARRRDRLDELGAKLASAHGVKVGVIEADLSLADAPEQVIKATAGMDIGLVVSNAGFSMKGEHEDNNADELTRMLMVNCHAPLQLTRAYIPRLKARGTGGILMTGSVEGLIGCPMSGAYSASKALVKALGEALWAELREHGIDVLTLCPGATDTEGFNRAGFDASKMPNVMKSSEVAALALDHIAEGPTYISSAHYQAVFDHMLSMPRPDALMAMLAGIKGQAKA